MKRIFLWLSYLWIICSSIYIVMLIRSPFSFSFILNKYCNTLIVVLLGCIISSFLIEFLSDDE